VAPSAASAASSIRSVGGGVTVRLDPVSFGRVMRDIKAFDPALAKALRVKFRIVAATVVADVKRTILEPTPGGADHNVGVRQGLADGTRLSILTGKRVSGVRISTSSAKLAAAHQAMAKAYNKRSFRHPVFGRDTWVSEGGRPYFGAVIAHHKAELHLAAMSALEEAAATVRAGR